MDPRTLCQLALTYVAVQHLTPDAANPRRHSPQQLKRLVQSIATFGFVVPALVDQNGLIIAGHARVEAARRLGLERVPVVRLDHLTPLQAKALCLADNRIAELATWDGHLLGSILLDLSQANLSFDIEATGFTVPEIDLHIQGLQAGIGEVPDPDDQSACELAPTAVSRVGDRWELGGHVLVCGDARGEHSYRAALSGEQASAIFTDAPYNVPVAAVVGRGRTKFRGFTMANGEMSDEQFEAFLLSVLTLLARHSVPGSLHYHCMDWRHVSQLLRSGEQVYGLLRNICIWDKGCPGMGSFYRSQHEMICVFQNGSAPARNNVQLGRFGRNRSNLWAYPRVPHPAAADDDTVGTPHPTPKPVAMIADALLDCTARREVVLDPFLGSGSSLIAAERVGRRCAGIELDPLYVDAAIRRWQRLTGSQAKLSPTGQTFNQLEAGEVRHVA